MVYLCRPLESQPDRQRTAFYDPLRCFAVLVGTPGMLMQSSCLSRSPHWMISNFMPLRYTAFLMTMRRKISVIILGLPAITILFIDNIIDNSGGGLAEACNTFRAPASFALNYSMDFRPCRGSQVHSDRLPASPFTSLSTAGLGSRSRCRFSMLEVMMILFFTAPFLDGNLFTAVLGGFAVNSHSPGSGRPGRDLRES